MKVLFFDCFSGISGDMTIGALLDLGIDTDEFKRELDKLKLDGYEIEIQKKTKNGIIATDFDVILHDEDGCLEEEAHPAHHDHHVLHEHQHSADRAEEGTGHLHHGRNLDSIESLIDASDLRQNVKDFSKKVFREIAAAEARVHNKNIREVHFHEVGAVDSIIDIVGTAICFDLLGIDRVFSSPVHEGHGFVKCQHGIIPVPVPAVMQMLAGSNIPIVSEDINTELVTPTGMGLLKSICSDYGSMPHMLIDKIGYGLGKKDTGKFNALRIIMGTVKDDSMDPQEIVVLETNIDDMSPEIMGFTADQLLKNGALDVFYTPIYMKKNRPAYMLTVLTGTQEEEKLVDIILRETSTLGIRRSFSKRYCMDRKVLGVNMPYGRVSVKVATRGDITKAAPEYEECRKIAAETGFPLWKIYQSVMEEYRNTIEKEEGL